MGTTYLDSYNKNIYSLIYTTVLKRLRDSVAIRGLAVYGILVGMTIVGLYSWSINRYQSAVPNCASINISNVTLCTF